MEKSPLSADQVTLPEEMENGGSMFALTIVKPRDSCELTKPS